MYRAGLRAGALRAASTTTTNLASNVPRRFASSSTAATATKKSTWRGTAVRWGLAIGAVYWYNTSTMFMDDVDAPPRPAPAHLMTDDKLTVESLIEEKRRQIAASKPSTPALAPSSKQQETQTSESEHPGTVETVGQPGVPEPATPTTPTDGPEPGSPEALEEEAGQQGAFNPETGEINWDCPCLGGMAHGPCGEEFKAAFSCFVFSDVEPKGMDCIDKFQHMQDCFRKYPEVYGSELADADDDEDAQQPADAAGAETPAPKDSHPATSSPQEQAKAETKTPAPSATKQHAMSALASDVNGTKQVLRESHEAIAAEEVPKQAFDATGANGKAKN